MVNRAFLLFALFKYINVYTTTVKELIVFLYKYMNVYNKRTVTKYNNNNKKTHRNRKILYI